MRPLWLVLPVSAAVIAALAAYRVHRPEPRALAAPAAAEAVRPAPAFRLYDEQSQLLRLERHLGREKLLVVFYDGREGPDASALVARLRRPEDFLRIHATGARVLAISAARPSQNRPPNNEQGERTTRAAPIPFKLLSDLNYEVHRAWGAYDDAADAPREAVFIVDRGGVIRHAHLGPDNLGSLEAWISELREVK